MRRLSLMIGTLALSAVVLGGLAMMPDIKRYLHDPQHVTAGTGCTNWASPRRSSPSSPSTPAAPRSGAWCWRSASSRLILPDAIRFCFDLCSEGTVAEGAELEIIETPGPARCRAVRRRSRPRTALRPLRLRQHRPAMAVRRRDSRSRKWRWSDVRDLRLLGRLARPGSPTCRAARRSPWTTSTPHDHGHDHDHGHEHSPQPPP